MTRLRARRLAALPAALVCCAAALAAGSPWATSAVAAQAASRHGTAGHPAARPGTNLLLNPGAQTGAFSARGWDALTIPGWQVTSGLPTVVRYGTKNFPSATGRPPAVQGGQMFAGGAGGTARLQQVVSLRSAAGQPVPAGTSFQLSGWLGGTTSSSAAVTVTFLSAAGRVLAQRGIGPAGGKSAPSGLALRAAAGPLPAGTASARVTLVLATSLTDIDGPDAPYVGYDRAVADGLRFSVSAAVRRPALLPPAAHIPRYQHVFLFYFENEGFHAIIGNTRQVPYMNSLLPRGSLLSDFFAEEHPSDGNYLALAGGSTFGVALDDPLEENPHYTIDARNIGDLIGAAHETWKAYLQSADGPCDNTVHGYYWDDDQPMTYFADVRERPAYCAAHLVPLQSLQTDLASAATTPNFAWVSPNDCTDMEACGLRAGDKFLATELGEIMRSPAWRTQRSLAIITFDEDSYHHQHPAQRVPTIILGSSGVRAGYVSHVRYTHYSLLRTIEGALGLGTLTPNDRYAQPVNDVFAPGPGTAPAPDGNTADGNTPDGNTPAASAAAADAKSAPVATAKPASHGGQTAFVVNSASASVTPIRLATGQAGPAIRVGQDPQSITVTPDGRTAYVPNSGSGTVTPIDTATWQAGRPIRVGLDPRAVAVTPNGKTAYVVNRGSRSVTPIDVADQQPGPPIRVGMNPQAIAITPDGRTAYVLDWGSASVTPIDTATGTAGRPIPVGSYPYAITITPDGSTAYVASYGSGTVTPITVATGRAGRPVPAGQAPDALAVTPDGRTVYAVGGDSDSLTPITAATGRAGRRIPVGYSPTALAITQSGGTAYVVNTISGTVTPVGTKSGQPGPPIPVGIYSYPTAIALTPSGGTAVVVGTYGGRVRLVDTHTRRVTAVVTVGKYPVAVAIAG